MFKFQQFDVVQEKSAMKVGTDGVLLGAWCSVDNAKYALDIGTGTGLLSLMIAQRNRYITVDAVEIDFNTAQEATENIKTSKFNNRIKVFNCSIQDFANGCNPIIL